MERQEELRHQMEEEQKNAKQSTTILKHFDRIQSTANYCRNLKQVNSRMSNIFVIAELQLVVCLQHRAAASDLTSILSNTAGTHIGWGLWSLIYRHIQCGPSWGICVLRKNA